MENQSQFESFELNLNETAVEYLKGSAKWSIFLAIFGFVGIALMLIVGVFMGTMLSNMTAGMEGASPMGAMGAMGGMIGVFYIIIALIYFFPVYYLFKYASNMKAALANRNNEQLTNGLGYLKSHHKFLGVMMLVMLSLYLVIIVGAVIMGMSGLAG